MKILPKICFVVLMGLFLTGCSGTYKSLSLGNIDKNNKTITIDSIDKEIFDIKVALVRSGWKIKIDNQEIHQKGTNLVRSEWKIKIDNQGIHQKGTSDKNFDVRTRRTFDTKYRMYMSMSYWPRVDRPIASYNITIVENETNFEILSLVAKRQIFVEHDIEDIAEYLITELQKIQK